MPVRAVGSKAIRVSSLLGREPVADQNYAGRHLTVLAALRETDVNRLSIRRLRGLPIPAGGGSRIASLRL